MKEVKPLEMQGKGGRVFGGAPGICVGGGDL